MAITDGVISVWECNEASGNLLDSVGGNTLTATNSPGSTTGKIGNARSFVRASSQKFDAADSAGTSAGDIDFTLAYWVRFTSLPASMDCVSKDSEVATHREYLTGYTSGSSGRFRFLVFDASTGNTSTAILASTFGTPSTGVWYWVVCWHDSVANTLNIQINNGAVDSTSYSSGIRDSDSKFTIGARQATGAELNGDMDQVVLKKGIWTDSEKTIIYNSGNGLAYPWVTGGPFPHYTRRRMSGGMLTMAGGL